MDAILHFDVSQTACFIDSIYPTVIRKQQVARYFLIIFNVQHIYIPFNSDLLCYYWGFSGKKKLIQLYSQQLANKPELFKVQYAAQEITFDSYIFQWCIFSYSRKQTLECFLWQRRHNSAFHQAQSLSLSCLFFQWTGLSQQREKRVSLGYPLLSQ